MGNNPSNFKLKQGCVATGTAFIYRHGAHKSLETAKALTVHKAVEFNVHKNTVAQESRLCETFKIAFVFVIYLEPICPLFWGLDPQQHGLL